MAKIQDSNHILLNDPSLRHFGALMLQEIDCTRSADGGVIVRPGSSANWTLFTLALSTMGGGQYDHAFMSTAVSRQSRFLPYPPTLPQYACEWAAGTFPYVRGTCLAAVTPNMKPGATACKVGWKP